MTSIRILELVIGLNENDSVVHRKKIKNEIQKLQILLRLCKDLSYLQFKRYEYASFLLMEMSELIDNEGGGDARKGLQRFV
ncbi:MAG: hypothetical protein HZB65_02080 [Candidatus Aenigmarchaeota archaeon]|nr:hypothetical protein [Candidatus Aenigmarchaeota archaeon]